MIPLILAVVVTGTAAYTVTYFYKRPRLKICGDSMYPTYRDGEVITGKRLTKGMRVYPGDVVVIDSPNGVRAIKRVVRINYSKEGHTIWVEGDNSEVSYDSRAYGWVPYESIVAVDPIKRPKEGNE